MSKIPFIEINQPIGTFYISKISAHQLIKSYKINRRENNKGIQRTLNNKKVKKIKNYCYDPDAIFPTPIIISVDSKIVKLEKNNIYFEENSFECEIIDGQHRIKGLEKSRNLDKFELPIIVMFDLDESEKAYIFSIINSNQTPVSKSLIYDLFDLSYGRSVYKTAHDIARALNSDDESALKGKLKMLGKKENEGETLSQGTFVTHLVDLYSKNPENDDLYLKRGRELIDDLRLPLRKYFIKEREDVMYKIIRNYFNAIGNVFNKEWNDYKKYILCKSTGYAALMKVFPYLYQLGEANGSLEEEFFRKKFELLKLNLEKNNIELNSEMFPSSAAQQAKLSNIMIELMGIRYDDL